MTFVVVDSSGCAVGVEVNGDQRMFPVEHAFHMSKVGLFLAVNAKLVGLEIPTGFLPARVIASARASATQEELDLLGTLEAAAG
jgi:hypothetical protein